MAEPIDWSKVPRTYSDGGWFWLSAEGAAILDAIAEDAADTADELSRAYQQTFRTPHGQRVLHDLISKTLVPPTWVPGVQDQVYAGFAREGQNSIIRYINTMIGSAYEHPTPVPRPPKETKDEPERQPVLSREITASRDFTPQADRPARRKRPGSKS